MESGKRVAGNMSDEILDRVINQFVYLDKKYPKDALRVGMQGLGEPLLYPRFFEVISRIRERMPRAYIHMNTNGILLNEENIERLVESELNDVIVGMNECSADDYKNCRGADIFELIKMNIEMLLKRKRKRKLAISVQLLNTCFNRPKIGKFRNYWLKQGANRVGVKPYYPRPQWVLQLMSDEYRQNYDKYFGIEQDEMEIYRCIYLRNRERVSLWVMVDKDGYIYPCITGILYTPNSEICLGNITEISIEEAFNRKLPHIKKLLETGRRSEIDACSTCIGHPRVIA